MEIEECIFGRRTVRNYLEQQITEETIREIINAGMYAPSACNFQAWKYIIITNDKNKERMFGGQL